MTHSWITLRVNQNGESLSECKHCKTRREKYLESKKWIQKYWTRGTLQTRFAPKCEPLNMQLNTKRNETIRIHQNV